MKQRSIYGQTQKTTETATSYFFDMLARLGQFVGSLTEYDKVSLIKSGLQPGALRYLSGKKARTVGDLQYLLKCYDKERRDDLLKGKEKGRRREELEVHLVENEAPGARSSIEEMVEKLSQKIDKVISGTSERKGKGGGWRSNDKLRTVDGIRCYRCQQFGHLARDCTAALAAASPSGPPAGNG
jgi:hypothetical protein